MKLKNSSGGSQSPDDISNSEFIFIAGYTSNGVPYGICRDETDGLDF